MSPAANPLSRQRILTAAARVFSESGFRGATTRRIAEMAGVNEVTLFRLFGSKSQLLAEAIKCCQSGGNPDLPSRPMDVERELTEWCASHLDGMRQMRFMIRATMAELSEHPEMAPYVCEAKTPQFKQLVTYARKLHPPASALQDAELRTACTMLMASLFADAMGREIMPAIYPAPAEDAASQYVRLFLRLIGAPRADGKRASAPRSYRSRSKST